MVCLLFYNMRWDLIVFMLILVPTFTVQTVSLVAIRTSPARVGFVCRCIVTFYKWIAIYDRTWRFVYFAEVSIHEFIFAITSCSFKRSCTLKDKKKTKVHILIVCTSSCVVNNFFGALIYNNT